MSLRLSIACCHFTAWTFLVNVMGVKLICDSDPDDSEACNFFALRSCRMSQTGVVMKLCRNDQTIRMAFATHDAATVVAAVKSAQSKLQLRHEVSMQKQQRRTHNALRAMFETVDSSGDGCIDVTEIAELLQTLGQQCTQAGLRDIVRRLETARWVPSDSQQARWA